MKDFDRLSYLQRHIKCHYTYKEYFCPACNYYTTENDSFALHLETERHKNNQENFDKLPVLPITDEIVKFAMENTELNIIDTLKYSRSIDGVTKFICKLCNISENPSKGQGYPVIKEIINHMKEKHYRQMVGPYDRTPLHLMSLEDLENTDPLILSTKELAQPTEETIDEFIWYYTVHIKKETQQESIDTEHAIPNYACLICHKTFKNRFPTIEKLGLNAHIKNHFNISTISDEMARYEQFNTYLKKKHPYIVHNIDLEQFSAMKNKDQNNKNNLSQKIYLKNYKCQKCEVTLQGIPNILQHIQFHLGQAKIIQNYGKKSIQCETCGMFQKSRNDLILHYETEHLRIIRWIEHPEDNKIATLPIRQRDKFVPEEIDLQDLGTACLENIKGLVYKSSFQTDGIIYCKICLACFSGNERRKLELHVKKHYKLKYFSCKTCDFEAVNRRDLRFVG